MTDSMNNDNEVPEDYQIDSDVAQLVMLGRIYDLMLVIAQKLSPEDTKEMLSIHAEGKFYGPPPLWNVDVQHGE